MPATYDRDLIGYGANPPVSEMAGRRTPRYQLRHELRGGLGALRAGRRGLHRGRPYGGAQPWPRRQGPRPRRRGHVRIRQQGRFLASDAVAPGAQATDDGIRLRPRTGTTQACSRRHPRLRFRRLLPRLALDQALRADRGRGARAHPQGRRVAADHGGRAAARLVLPLRAERQHAAPHRRGGWVPV